MAAPVVLPITQFCDANGKPYAGGTIATYIMGSTTSKATYTDQGLTSLNTNPIVLDSAGRCTMWADGDLRLILRDAVGNEIWDITATTIVSAAMAPIVSAPTVPEALRLLGVTAMLAAEAQARANADAAEANERLQADIAEANARIAEDNTINNTIHDTQVYVINADTNLQNQITALSGATPTNPVTMQTGTGTSDGAGVVNVTFPAAYLLHTVSFSVRVDSPYPTDGFFQLGIAGAITTTSAVGELVYHAGGGDILPLVTAPFTWFAAGT